VVRVYNLREIAALFLEEHLVRDDHFVSKLAYLNYIFEKFSTLNPSMQANDTNSNVVTDKVKAFIGKLGLWIRKRDGKNLDKFSRFKGFVEENSVEKSDAGIEQCIKDNWVNQQSRFPKYFSEAVSDKYK
jgi:hypothetical protein